MRRRLQNHELSQWVEETAPGALAYAVTLVRDATTAEDLVQDCYQRLISKSDEYDLVKDGKKLLFKSITNACINWTTRQSELSGLEIGAAESESRGPVDFAIHNELSAAVDEALATLPVDQRATMELHVMGYSAAEVAEMLEITSGNARVLLHRARGKLAEQLRNYLE
ncbi:RNA polymerase sigma factor [Rubinisphaera margarita]|uniref:RNA polymerase sigma factor n=1 Tax=Rubinisphaera margarita TaxID=2909586 RepID=UPI001EE7F463|nr:sigma-70 family RNA polymerase sigma factor [Rubinisphaera margarita]MCG6158131.1 sigma-70 family RNA polymerase sigma factor [Rubinisphaera margarita]